MSNDVDPIESSIDSTAVAEDLFAQRDPDWRQVIKQFFDRHRDQFPPLTDFANLVENALVLAAARVATRYGSWGDDFHPYHNEHHIRELLERRIELLISQLGWDALAAEDWLALWLFAACHDLRQREPSPAAKKEASLIGANEAASVAESWRILDACGFDRNQHQGFYHVLRLLIAASTFGDGGNHADRIARLLKADPAQEQLALLAADIDTANVAETFAMFVRTGVRLIKEFEYRVGRAELGRDSAQAVLEFLTIGQQRYFFEQQQFASALGRKVFGPRKQRNHRPVKMLCDGLEQHYEQSGLSGITGGMIIEEFLDRAQKMGA